MVKEKIFIADDETILTETLQNILSVDYDIVICNHRRGVLHQTSGSESDLILLDIFMGKTNGLQLLRKLKEEAYDIPVLMMTAHADVALAVEAMKEGAVDFVIKPFDLSHLSVLIEKSMEQSRLKKKVQILQEELEQQRTRSGIIGKSTALRRILEMSERLAESDNTTVLIEGESGTGKELLARFVYQKSPRRTRRSLRSTVVQSRRILLRVNSLDLRKARLPVRPTGCDRVSSNSQTAARFSSTKLGELSLTCR